MIKRKSSVKIKILSHHQHMSFKMSRKMINHQLKQKKNWKNITSIWTLVWMLRTKKFFRSLWMCLMMKNKKIIHTLLKMFHLHNKLNRFQLNFNLDTIQNKSKIKGPFRKSKYNQIPQWNKEDKMFFKITIKILMFKNKNRMHLWWLLQRWLRILKLLNNLNNSK